MYKLTFNGKTMVGNNEDSWGRDARIWFEQGINGKFGVVCVGYARKQHPDGAMNEHGLVFDAFSMPHKPNIPERDPNKKDFAYAHVKTIMQQCKTVDEVYAFLEKMNLHVLNGSIIFNGGMLLFVDKSGKYLVVEASKMTFGNDDKFALANFSIADTKDLSTIKTERYCKGIAFLNNKKLDTSLSFCTALSDTMSVNRAKVGDGTLYTSVYDLDEGLIHLYFYHDFSKLVTFNLKEELAKGDHSYSFAELFPDNQNYQKFLDYKTPQNSKVIFFFIVSCGLLFSLSSAFFLISFFKSSNINYKYLKLGLATLGIALGVYAFILLRNEGIFYFSSPYNDGHSLIVAMTSYLPFVLLIAIFPLLKTNFEIFRKNSWNYFIKWLYTLNNIAFLGLLGLFAYWGFFDVLS
ncbi:MAG: linear amide C-N hydrolase [Cytophagales bacterium]|nr:MAG: linear amide C-N hydrolase [Cytophagales bacterium]